MDDGLVIRMLGPLEVLADGAPLVVDTRKALAILALLATEGRPYARDELAALLWPDADGESARGALRRTLSTLRAALSGRWLTVDRFRVALDGAGVVTDLARATTLAAGDSAADLAAAAELHRGPFLAGFSLRDAPAFDDWQASRATSVAVHLSALLERLASARLSAGDVAGAVAAARRRVDADPLDEGAQRRLIELLAVSGDRAGAIRQYRACVAVLDAELGVPPLDETTELYEQIRDDHGLIATTTPEREPKPAQPDAGAHLPALGALREPPLVGRDADLEALLGALGVAAKAGRVAIVEGEAGIGKTRLLEAFANAARARESRVIGTRGNPGEHRVAYAPTIALLRAAFVLPGAEERLAALGGAAREALLSLAPDLPASPATRAIGTLSALDPRAARARLLDAVVDALSAAVAGSPPGVVWIDDLHLADEATLEVLAYLGRRLAGRSLLLLVSWRREDLDGPSAALAGHLERQAVAHRRLGRLARDDVAALVSGLDRQLPPAAVDRLFERSEGLPLYIVEAIAAEQDAPDSVTVPPGVRAIVAERLNALDGAASQLLGAAAVIGRSFDLETVRAASGRSEDETVDALDRLVRRGFLREWAPVGSGPPAFDFSHASVRDVAFSDLSLARRRLLHRRVAEAFAGRSIESLADPAVVERLEGRTAAAIAPHLAAAGHDLAGALTYQRAGDHSRAVHANAEAIDHFEAAIALGHPEPERLHVAAGDVATLRGEYDRAVRHYEAAAGLVGTGDQLAIADIDHRLALVHQRRGEPGIADAYFRAALAALPPGSRRANALADHSLNARDAGERAAAAALADEALHEAETSGSEAAVARAANVAGLLATEAGDPEGGRRYLERSLALAAANDDPAGRIAALNNLARAVAAGGDVQRAIGLTREALDLCVRIGDRHREAALHNNLADLLRDADRRDEAMAHLKTAVAIFAEVGEPGALEPGKWRMATW